jgi:hypothetical protein
MTLILSGTDGLSDVDGSAATPAIRGTDANTGIFFPAADTIAFSEGGTEAMRLDSAGNMGLGTTPSSWDSTYRVLQIGGNALISSGEQAGIISGNAYYNSGWKYIGSSKYAAYYEVNKANGGIHAWYNAPSGTAGNAITFTQAMTLDASGNLGIGTSSPSALLHVRKDQTAATYIMADNQGTVNAATSSGFACAEGGSVTAFFRSLRDATGIAQLFNTSASPLTFGTNNTERARIDSSGNLLVGTTTAITTGRFVLKAPATTNLGEWRVTTNGYGMIMYNASDTQVGYIGINASTTTYNTGSDYRLKENIAPMTGALAKVAQLKPCTYTWKATGEDGQGFIAHELSEVIPDAVSGEKDAVDEKGNPRYQGVDTSFLVATLTAAIQEQQALITTLTDRITALETPTGTQA